MNKSLITFLFLACIFMAAFAKPVEQTDSTQMKINSQETSAIETSINTREMKNEFEVLQRSRRSPGFWEFLCGRLKSCQ